jgi:myo-inositol-1-phosphate synthase
LVTERPPFSALDCCPVSGLSFGGLEVRAGSLTEQARRLRRESRTFDRETLEAVAPDLIAIDDCIVQDPEFDWDVGAPVHGLPPLRALIERLVGYLNDFRVRHDLETLLVVNLTSAAPTSGGSDWHTDLAGLESIVADDRKDLFSPSACYAYAALSAGCPLINFTPNPETSWPGLAELAARTATPYVGNDGKTGETLLKTVLAPMFAHRNLRVLSWEGINLLGNNDGLTLDDPRNRRSKISNKEQVLAGILGYEPHAGVTINYVPSLGDWKTAWDLIHFTGFMDVPMTMQFTWQGCDSVLAAPLVLDLARLMELAARRGESGPMLHLACFFKSPLGVTEMDFHRQYDALLAYTERCLAGKPPADPTVPRP